MRVTVKGDLLKAMIAEANLIDRAAEGAIKETTEATKLALRAQVTSAGMGQRLANSWRGQFWENKGGVDSAGSVWSKAPHIITAYDRGVVIRAAGGRYLAIPTENVIRRAGQKLRPADFAAAGIPLRFVPAKGSRPALLVVDDLTASISRKTGRLRGFRFTTAKTRRRGVATVVMFMLIAQARVPKRLDVDAVERQASEHLPGLMIQRIEAG